MGVDDVRHGVIADIPHMFNDRRSRKHTILVSQEELEQGVLFVRQSDFLSCAPDTMRSRIQLSDRLLGDEPVVAELPRRKRARIRASSSTKANGFGRN